MIAIENARLFTELQVMTRRMSLVAVWVSSDQGSTFTFTLLERRGE